MILFHHLPQVEEEREEGDFAEACLISIFHFALLLLILQPL